MTLPQPPALQICPEMVLLSPKATERASITAVSRDERLSQTARIPPSKPRETGCCGILCRPPATAPP